MTRDDGYTRYTVRIPTPLYERVKAASGQKSVNAEIVATLEEKYPEPTLDQQLASLEKAFVDGLEYYRSLPAGSGKDEFFKKFETSRKATATTLQSLEDELKKRYKDATGGGIPLEIEPDD